MSESPSCCLINPFSETVTATQDFTVPLYFLGCVAPILDALKTDLLLKLFESTFPDLLLY